MLFFDIRASVEDRRLRTGRAALPRPSEADVRKRAGSRYHSAGPGQAGGAQLGGGCKTNPILCRPARKSAGNEAKNEANYRIRQRLVVRLGFLECCRFGLA